MREPQLIAQPVHVPGRCFACGSSEGPVVDTMVDLVGDGRIYLCIRTCLASYARLADWVSPEEADELVGDAQRLAGMVQGLEQQLAFERENKVVSLSDMTSLIDRMREAKFENVTGHVPSPAFATHGLVDTNGEAIGPQPCSATKTNGEPCTARALPGRDVCVAHSKKPVTA